jgi:hypothetical protein
MSKFEYSDENIFNHALKKIGAWRLVGDGEEMTGKEEMLLDALKCEYERVKHHHLRDGGKHQQESHSKATKLMPYGESHPHWWYTPDDIYNWGATSIEEKHTLNDGREIVKISAIEGDVVYNAKGSKHVTSTHLPMETAELILRDFTLQAAIMCAIDSAIIQELRRHRDDLMNDKQAKVMHETFNDFFEEIKKHNAAKASAPTPTGYSYNSHQTPVMSSNYMPLVENIATNVMNNIVSKGLGGLLGGK